jgi:hypothetical protein
MTKSIFLIRNELLQRHQQEDLKKRHKLYNKDYQY